jgi:hypothetical protein
MTGFSFFVFSKLHNYTNSRKLDKHENYNNKIYILRRLNKYMLLVNHKKTDNDIYISHRINIYL